MLFLKFALIAAYMGHRFTILIPFIILKRPEVAQSASKG